ncbi:MAG: hypothetical protein WBB28_17810, partial [Crinalium sp.]
KLAESSSVIVRYYLAANPQVPVSVLRKLAENEESPLVLENIAWNPNAPEDLLADIRESGEKWAIVTEIDPYLDVEQIGNDYQIASHINTSLTTLEKLAKHENWLVRYLVINNPNTPKSLADAIVSEIAQTESLPDDDSRKCLVLNMLGKMPSHIPFKSDFGLPIIAIADEIVDFRWHYFEGDSLSFYDGSESRVIGVLQKGELQENVNEDKFKEVCRIVSIKYNDLQLDDIKNKHKHLITDELAANFVHFQCWLRGEGFLFIPYTYDFLQIYNQGNYDTSDAGYWTLDRSYYNTAEYWLDRYLEYINDWYIQECDDIFYGNEFNEIVDKLHWLAATHQEHSQHGLFFWDDTVIKNPDLSYSAEDRNPVFNRDTFCCNPEYDIQSMLQTIKQNSGLTTQDELKATISRLLEIAPLAYDEDEIVAVLALHQDLVIQVSGLQIVRDSDEIDENNKNKLYFYIDDTCIDYDSFVAKQNWDSLFEKSEGNTLLPYVAYLLIKIILLNKSGEN